MGDAGLNGRVEVLDADAQHLVHPRQVDADAAAKRQHLPLERRAGAERNDRHVPRGRGAHDGADLVRVCGYATRSGAAGVWYDSPRLW